MQCYKVCVFWNTFDTDSLLFSRYLEYNNISFIPDGSFQELKDLRNLWVLSIVMHDNIPLTKLCMLL